MELIDITPILQAGITLILAALTTFAIPWLKKKVGAENMETFLGWVDIGVAAAEQLFSSEESAAKKQYVLNFLAEKGYTTDVDALNNAIEAAVLRLHAELYGTETEVTDGKV